MKKSISVLITLLLVFALASCSGGEEVTTEDASLDNSAESGHSHAPASIEYAESLETGMTEEFDADEDALYQELIINKGAAALEGKEYTKKGTFAILKDAYAETDRYYVWGYKDENRDSCYQWEFVMPEGAEIPASGSYIEIKGVLKENSSALDKYWLDDVEILSVTPFENEGIDVDFTTLSPTLTRVQMSGLFYKSEHFVDTVIRIIGVTTGPNTIASLNESVNWSLHFIAAEEELEAEKNVLMTGIFNEDGTSSVLIPSEIIIAE